MNLQLIAPAAHEAGVHLFDPQDVIVGQEDRLVQRMVAANVSLPVVALCVFLFHFKSVTVRAASAEAVAQQMQRHSVAVQAEGRGGIMVRLSYKDGNRSVSKSVDIREDLRWYHPESGTAFSEGVPGSHATTSAEHGVAVEEGVQRVCAGHSAAFPWAPRWNTAGLFSDNITASTANGADYCVYPAQWAPSCPGYGTSSVAAFPRQRTVVFAIATSDPAKTPSAGDIFTAYELGAALQQLGASGVQVQVRFLRRGPQWYSAQLLRDVDVLIALLDAYDLSKVQVLADAFPRSKPPLLAVAWMRNWFHRWLARPWLGSFDLLLASSALSAAFLQDVAQHVGFPVLCHQACPRGADAGAGGAGMQGFSWRSRAAVPVAVFPLATSLSPSSEQSSSSNHSSRPTAPLPPPSSHSAHFKHRHGFRTSSAVGSSGAFDATAWTSSVFEGVHYLFSGSYYGQQRSIMSFDPAELPRWRGRVVGDGWTKAPNMTSWADISVGRLPYEMVKQAYRCVRLVVDDANHVTGPWASVNSRVFDALAAGALVISNGALGMQEVFGAALAAAALPLPVYTDGRDLAAAVDFYLEHETLRKQLVSVMQGVVLQHHSYALRARQLADLLQPLGVDLLTKSDSGPARQLGGSVEAMMELLDEVPSAQDQHAGSSVVFDALDPALLSLAPSSEPITNASSSSLCVGVRTMESQSGWLAVLLQSLAVQHAQSQFRDRISLRIVVTDTEASAAFQSTLLELADRMNAKQLLVEVMAAPAEAQQTSGNSSSGNAFYGYDATDRVLDYLLSGQRAHESRRHRQQAAGPCEWIMFTNGDNMYNSAWFSAV